MTRAALEGYGFSAFATIRIEADSFIIDIQDEALGTQTMCLYAFLIQDEIVRIGSSKAALNSRMGSWRKDVSGALAGNKTSTPDSEAMKWRAALNGSRGEIYARPGTEVTTRIGTFNAYMAEESYLLGLHRPKMNRSFHR